MITENFVPGHIHTSSYVIYVETICIAAANYIYYDNHSILKGIIPDKEMKRTMGPTNKSMINTRKIETTVDTIGDGWDGKEDLVLGNLNAIRHGIYDALPDEATDEDMENAFKLLWDLFGSDDTLMEELDGDEIEVIVNRLV